MEKQKEWKKPIIEEIDPDAYEPSPEQETRFHLLTDILAALYERHVTYTVAGGYGLDGLYGKLTRDHDDIDLIVTDADAGTTRTILEALGFRLERIKAWKVEVYRHNATRTKLELAFPSLIDFPREIDIRHIFPEKVNASIQGDSFRSEFCALTLEGQEAVSRIQNRRSKELGWGEYRHTYTQQMLMERIRAGHTVSK